MDWCGQSHAPQRITLSRVGYLLSWSVGRGWEQKRKVRGKERLCLQEFGDEAVVRDVCSLFVEVKIRGAQQWSSSAECPTEMGRSGANDANGDQCRTSVMASDEWVRMDPHLDGAPTTIRAMCNNMSVCSATIHSLSVTTLENVDSSIC